MQASVAGGQHGGHRPGHLHRTQEKPEHASRRRSRIHERGVLRIRLQPPVKQDFRGGKPNPRRGEDHHDRNTQQRTTGEERGSLGKRTKAAGVLQQRRMGGAGQPQPSAERPWQRKRDSQDGDGWIRRHRAERTVPQGRGQPELCRYHQLRPWKAATRKGKGERTRIL